MLGVSRASITRKLKHVADDLKRLRADLLVAEEQVAHFVSEADDARLRAMVSETPLADAEAREALRHAEAQRQAQTNLLRSIADLEREQDSLLDRMSAETS